MDREERLKASLWRRAWFPLVVLAFGVALTGALTAELRRSIEDDAREQFDMQAEQAANAIKARIQAYADALYAVRALFHISERVTQEAFRVFVEKLELDKRYPALRNLNYATYVRGEDRAALEAAIRSDTTGGTAARTFAVRPSVARREHYVITHIAPLQGNERSFGLDIGAPPFQPDTLEHGRDSGRLVSSGRILRVEDGVDFIVMRIAVYRAGARTDTVEERRKAYVGSVGAGFHIAELMHGVLEAQNLRHMRFRVMDIDRERGAESLIFDNAVARAGPDPRYTTRRQIEMGGRLWELDFSATERSLVPGHDRQFPWLVFVCGVLASLLLASMVFFIGASRHRALMLARRMNRELHVHEARLTEAQRMARLGSWEISGASRHMFWSEELYRIFGMTPRSADMALDDFLERVHPADRQKVRNMLRLSSEPGSVLELEHRLRLPDGTERWVLTKAKLDEPIGEGGVWRGTTMDITERKRAEFDLQVEHEVTRILAAGGPRHGALLQVLRLLCARLNMVCAVHWEVEGERSLRCGQVWCTEKVERSDRVHARLEAEGSALAQRALEGRRVVLAAEAGLAQAAPRAPMHPVAASPIIGANGVLGVIELFSEAPVALQGAHADLLGLISAQLGQYHAKALAEEALQAMPAHDPLTGLPNRAALENRLSSALLRSRRARRMAALLIVDLDRFKLVNESRGHAVGDRFLQSCARRIAGALRASDTVARIGADEFAVVLEDLGEPSEAATVVQKLLQVLAHSLVIEGRELRPSATVGISLYPAHGDDAATLMKHAGVALDHARQQARGGYRFFAA